MSALSQDRVFVLPQLAMRELVLSVPSGMLFKATFGQIFKI